MLEKIYSICYNNDIKHENRRILQMSKKDRKSVVSKILVKVMAGVLAAMMILSVGFTLIFYLISM